MARAIPSSLEQISATCRASVSLNSKRLVLQAELSERDHAATPRGRSIPLGWIFFGFFWHFPHLKREIQRNVWCPIWGDLPVSAVRRQLSIRCVATKRSLRDDGRASRPQPKNRFQRKPPIGFTILPVASRISTRSDTRRDVIVWVDHLKKPGRSTHLISVRGQTRRRTQPTG